MKQPILVVGGGPAGLMAAIAAATGGRAVTLYERLQHSGAKLMASGGGHCNLSNVLPEDKFMVAFGKHGRFMHPALKNMGQDGLREFLASIGVQTHVVDGFKVLPVSDSALEVRDALLRVCAEQGVRVLTGIEAGRLSVHEGRVTGMRAGSDLVAASAVVIASGGKGYSKLGGCDSGYVIARECGHTVVEPLPALVPMLATETWIAGLAGVSLKDARIRINLPKRDRTWLTGDLLFTHRGLSGPAALDISGAVSELLRTNSSVPLSIDLSPGMDDDEWNREFDTWQKTAGRKQISNLMDWKLPSKLADVVCRIAGIAAGQTASVLKRADREVLAKTVKEFPVTIKGTEGFEQAMVTRGGVSLKEVDPQTLQSRSVKGLFFAGEVLDLDGPTGGYNLQWAFSSGRLAGQSAGRI